MYWFQFINSTDMNEASTHYDDWFFFKTACNTELFLKEPGEYLEIFFNLLTALLIYTCNEDFFSCWKLSKLEFTRMINSC